MQIRLLEPKMSQNKYLKILILFILLKLYNIKFNTIQNQVHLDCTCEVILF